MTRGLVLVLTLLTGFTGLVYEVAWQKYLATLLFPFSFAAVQAISLWIPLAAPGVSFARSVDFTSSAAWLSSPSGITTNPSPSSFRPRSPGLANRNRSRKNSKTTGCSF